MEAKQEVLNKLTKKFDTLENWQIEEAKDLKIIAESYEFLDLVEEINYKFYL